MSPHPLLLKLGHVQDTGTLGPAQPPANGFEARQEPDRSHPTASQRSRKELIFSASSRAKHNKIALVDMCLGNDIGFQLKQSKPQCHPLLPRRAAKTFLFGNKVDLQSVCMAPNVIFYVSDIFLPLSCK